MLLVIVGGTNIRDYNRQKEAELNQIRQESETLKMESEQLQQAKDKLEEEKKKLEKDNEKLQSDLRAKKEQQAVRVASAVKTQQTASVSVKQGVEQWRPLVSKHFPTNQVETALRVMSCESGGSHLALNNNPATGDYSVGLFQINLFGNLAKSRPSEAWLKVPENNIQYAARMSRNGWGAWSCYRKI